MVDMHCHILPGADDGAKSIKEARRMLEIAQSGGIRTIIATPHYRGRYRDRSAQFQAYRQLLPEAEERGIELLFGCEFHYAEFEAEEVPNYRERFCLGDTNRLLFELGTHTLFADVEEWIYCMQRHGLEIILAHPERNAEFQGNRRTVDRYAEIGCRFQVSADALLHSPFSVVRRTANDLIRRNLCDFVASDAHSPEDYEQFLTVLRKLNRE